MFIIPSIVLASKKIDTPAIWVVTDEKIHDLYLKTTDFYIGKQGSYINVDSIVKELNRVFPDENWIHSYNPKNKEIIVENIKSKSVYKLNNFNVIAYDKSGDIFTNEFGYSYDNRVTKFENFPDLMYPILINKKTYIPTKYLNSLGFDVAYNPNDFAIVLLVNNYNIDVQSDFYGYEKIVEHCNWHFDPYVDFLGYPLNWSDILFRFEYQV